MFETIYSQIGITVTVLVVGFALVKGEEPERLASAAFVVIILAGMFAPDGSGSGAKWGSIGRDSVLLAVFAGLAFQSRRNWLYWASASQSLIVTGHILMLANIRPPGDAFAAVNNMANYGVLIALAVGTFWAWQERRAAGLK